MFSLFLKKYKPKNNIIIVDDKLDKKISRFTVPEPRYRNLNDSTIKVTGFREIKNW